MGDAPSVPRCIQLMLQDQLGSEDVSSGIHPIAIGEVIRRLVAKCFCNAYERDATAYLWPRQIGVAAPLGAEVGSQTVQQWCERNQATEGKYIFNADFENAFNRVDRALLLDLVIALVLEAANVFWWLYELD